jgi:hypothetical protein
VCQQARRGHEPVRRATNFGQRSTDSCRTAAQFRFGLVMRQNRTCGEPTLPQLRIGVENSTWNNVGDGFYQFALHHILGSVYHAHDVVVIDGPVVRGFRAGSYASRAFDSRMMVDIDVAVFSGPILKANFTSMYLPIVRRLMRAGKAYMILSAYCDRDESAIATVRAALAEHPPIAISTRDSYTFERFHDLASAAYNGICTAFFVSKIPGVASAMPDAKYLILSTYTMYEPRFSFEMNERGMIDLNSLAVQTRQSVIWRAMRHSEWLRPRPAAYRGHEIVRVHQALYPFNHILFSAPNSYVSHNPLCYLPLYNGASLVISDRVHACVAALSFGRPAFFLGKSPRAELFERAGAAVSNSGVLHLSGEALEGEYRRFCGWLSALPLE